MDKKPICTAGKRGSQRIIEGYSIKIFAVRMLGLGNESISIRNMIAMLVAQMQYVAARVQDRERINSMGHLICHVRVIIDSPEVSIVMLISCIRSRSAFQWGSFKPRAVW